MKVLIAGGSGLIGREFVKQLLEAGDHPLVLTRQPAGTLELPPGVTAIQWDGKSAQGWGDVINTVDAVVNLAGENIAGEKFFPARWTPQRKALILQSRLDAGTALVEAIQAAEKKPLVFVQSSAIGYYGTQGDEPLTETSPTGSDFVAEVSQQWEAVSAAVEALGVRRVIVRTGVVLSLAGGALPRMLLPYRLFAGGTFGHGRQWYSWIHIADTASALRFVIANSQANGVVNLTAPNPLTNADFGKALGKVMRRPSVIPLPGFVMRLMFGEVATVVLDGQRVLPEKLQALGFSFKFPTAETAFRDLLGK
jgi:uncharacterized protein